MRFLAAVVCGLCAAAPAAAAPAADVVIVWGEPHTARAVAAVTDAATRAGVAVIDLSPAPPLAPEAGPQLARGIDAYNAIEFDAALTALDGAVAEVDRTGGGGLDPSRLGDLFLYRGMVHVQRGDDARAWDDFVTAAGLAPARVLDPARFAPRVIETYARAVAAIGARDRARVTLAPRGCKVMVDGQPVAGDSVELGFGRHWVRAECDGREARGQRIELDRPTVTLDVAGPELAPPTDDDLLVQARVAGSRAAVIVTVRGGVALARRLGLDGREQDRRSTAYVADGDAPAVGRVVDRLLAVADPTTRAPWYRSRWVWAAAGAAVAGAILLPFALTSGGSSSVSLRPEGLPGW